MDLGAYVQIEELDDLAKKNGIEVPRCRGYRLMANEESVTQEELREMIQDQAIREAEKIIRISDFPVCKSCWRSYDSASDKRIEYYMIRDESGNGCKVSTGIRWDRVHGKFRKRLKLAIKHATRRITKQYDLWNRFAGEKNVLYIHARIGSTSWTDAETKGAITREPWFLEKVDDYWDTSYCDIYARVEVDPDDVT